MRNINVRVNYFVLVLFWRVRYIRFRRDDAVNK